MEVHLFFLGLVFLKQKLEKQNARTLEGVWKLSKEILSTIDLKTYQKRF